MQNDRSKQEAHRLIMSMPSWYACSAAAMMMVLAPVVPSQLKTRYAPAAATGGTLGKEKQNYAAVTETQNISGTWSRHSTASVGPWLGDT